MGQVTEYERGRFDVGSYIARVRAGQCFICELVAGRNPHPCNRAPPQNCGTSCSQRAQMVLRLRAPKAGERACFIHGTDRTGAQPGRA